MTELNRVELNEMEVEEVVGGKHYTVHGTKHFLGLRSSAKYDDKNIIGKLHNGDKVKVLAKKGTYWIVKTHSGKIGYVNHRYLRG